MQAVILAAGQSSRFYPFSNGVHKTMISLLGKPILAHTVEGIKNSGINELIMIVRGDGVIEDYFGTGGKFGVDVTYIVQEEPLGMGDALLKAGKHINGEFILLGGNHVNSAVLLKELINKKQKDVDGVVIVKKRINTWEYGVVSFDMDTVSSIVEKPKKGTEPSNYCLVSIYLLPLEFMITLKKTKNHHYNFEEALDVFARKRTVKVHITEQEIATLKYPWNILDVKNQMLRTNKKHIGKNATIAKSVEIMGNVWIEDGAQLLEGVRIKGPCYIGKNVYIGNNSLLRDGVDVEGGATIGAYTEVKNTLIMAKSKTHSGFIGDSVIGENCRIGAQFCTANVRLDRETVKTVVKNEKIDTGFKSLGVMMGENVRIGIKSSTMPGVVIGNNTVIGPSTVVHHNIPENVRYFTKFKEVVMEKGAK